jgi:hypothetical protein
MNPPEEDRMSHIAHKQPVPIGLRRRALIAVVALLAIAALVIVLLAAGGDNERGAPAASGVQATTLNHADGIRYDGGPDEGTRGIVVTPAADTTDGIRYDGGPEEGRPASAGAAVKEHR